MRRAMGLWRAAEAHQRLATSEVLTLITCLPFAHVGPSPDRFIVRAYERE
jgi:hypothetical protein